MHRGAAAETAAAAIAALARPGRENSAPHRIERLVFADGIKEAMRAIGLKGSEEKDAPATFFRVRNRQEETAGYFYTQRDIHGREFLRKCRIAPGLLPDPATCQHIWEFARDAGMILPPDAGEAGVFVHNPLGHAIALQSLPQGFISHEAFSISGVDNEITLQNLKQVNAPSGALSAIEDCPNFLSLGDLEFSGCSLHIENCENFQSLGRLKQVGAKGTRQKVSLAVVNCPKLKHLGDLRRVEGDLDLRGTGINAENFPACFEAIAGNVYLDEGAFAYQGKGWRFPLKPIRRSLWENRNG
jgi:hypothetical protein